MKEKIRKEILKRRNKLDEKEWEEKSLIIQKKLLSTQFYKDAKVIFTYYHFDREVKTDFIIKTAFQDDKIVCLPKNDRKRKEMIPVQILSFEEIDIEKKIPEPKSLRYIEENEIDIVIVPGVVFDIYGNRIGMGGGFYDKFIGKVKGKVITVSPAFDFQVLDEKLPVSSFDEKVDIIITEKRLLSFSNFSPK